MNWALAVAAFSALFFSVHSSYYKRTVSYEGDKVLRCSRYNAGVEKVMNHPGVDVWKVDPNGNVDMKMGRKLAEIVMSILHRYCSVMIHNVEDHVQIAEQSMLSRNQDDITTQGDVDRYTTSKEWFKHYHDYKSIQNWYKRLSEDYPHLVKYVPSIGKTIEGRDMIGVHITASNNPERHKFYIQCQIHAREWISGAACMYQAKKLVESYSTDNMVKDILEKLEFVFVPVVNPDGYAFTWEDNRLWRKNRRIIEHESCVGVDLNRNFNSGWHMGSDNVCMETYHGSKAASEPEVQNLIKYFKENKPIVAALDIHSYSQLILRPWGFKKERINDETKLSYLGELLSKKIYEIHRTYYKSERSIDLYQANGVAGDWFYSKEASEGNNGYRPISYTIELRDKGSYGFLLPAKEILPTSEELWSAVKFLAEYVTKKPITYDATTDSEGDFNFFD